MEYVLEAAARVFRREGFGATTNRIAREAGLSIGSLYEYFDNKQVLLEALARRHVELAEHGITEAIDRGGSTRELLANLQRAVIASQRFPSQALTLIETESALGQQLRRRADTLREHILATLSARALASGARAPALRARAAFGAIAQLTSQTMYELDESAAHAALCGYLLEMAVHGMTARD